MQALFIGHAYIDVTMLTDVIPTGDEKAVAQDYAVSFGGNAVTAGFAYARLMPGSRPDLIANASDDWLGRMFADMAIQHGVRLHPRPVEKASLSFILPKGGKRAILRARDDAYLHPFPPLDLTGCRLLHVDGHMADAALHYLKIARERGILTSLDGGAVRADTDAVLRLTDVAVVSERFAEQLGLSDADTLAHLKTRGCRIGAVTQGERGMLWYDENGEVRRMPALPIPAGLIVDTSGAGDVFHGAYLAAWAMNPTPGWEAHFAYARAASAHAIQILGNEAKMPTREDVERTIRTYERPS